MASYGCLLLLLLGMQIQCYLPIIASGHRAATLHYTKNNQVIPSGPHSLVLVDAGGERRCYGRFVTQNKVIRSLCIQDPKLYSFMRKVDTLFTCKFVIIVT